jgi:PAS domain-containing protein
MKNERKTKKVLIEELNVLRKQINMLIQLREEQGVLLESNKESDKILRALLSNPADAFVLVDTKGTLLDFNETTARRLGKTPEAIIGASVYDLLPKDVRNSDHSGRHNKVCKPVVTLALRAFS